MCDHEQRLVASVEESLQPLDHLEVQVVGGLVEYQQVGLGDEHVGQCHALLLSAAELTHGLLQVAYLELCQDLLRLEYLLLVALMVETGIEHRVVGLECGCLFQESHLEVAPEDDVSAVVSLLAREYREQRGLTRAVLGDESHALSLSNRERDILEQHRRAKRLGEVLYV